jgi:HD-GYP domain-containing protein (c-di-GMP phosphodiesterase class II)
MLAPLESLVFFKKVSEAILYHHERVDGKGYHGLPEDKIPYVSKIILVVDTVDAMTQDRPYRKGCTMERAIEELVLCSGTQFDATIANCYIQHISPPNQNPAASFPSRKFPAAMKMSCGA